MGGAIKQHRQERLGHGGSLQTKGPHYACWSAFPAIALEQKIQEFHKEAKGPIGQASLTFAARSFFGRDAAWARR